jgi:anti-sigma-K factor RskA
MSDHPMAHDDARERLEDLALGVLDALERARVVAHVAECNSCREELDVLRRTAEALVYAVAPVPMMTSRRDRVRSRLLTRARAERHESVVAGIPAIRPIAAAPTRRTRFARSTWVAAAASLVAVLSVGAMMRMRHEQDKAIATLTGRNVAVMKLAAVTPRAPSGMIFWDQARGDWTLVAHNLRMPKAGRGYQLWLVTPRAKISGGMFMPDAHGDAMMRMHHTLAADSLAALAVTEEPRAGSAQPTTPPLMVASANPR